MRNDAARASAEALVEAAIQRLHDGDRVEAERLARQAVDGCPQCPDAHLTLGVVQEDATARLSHFRAAVAAGLQGATLKPQGDGSLWHQQEARPLLRARHALAVELWRQEEANEAIDEAATLLSADPDDHLGIRMLLAGWLLQEERNEECRALMTRYDLRDGRSLAPEWNAMGALLCLRLGDADRARKLLDEVDSRNPAITHHLMIGTDYQDCDDIDLPEGVHYNLWLHGDAWAATPGAQEWLYQRRLRREAYIPF
jgi:tetratricopeptide (TPR) repeat protein